jgi:hypothetical protein
MFSRPRQHLASSIDFATWYLDLQHQNNWPSIDEDRIGTYMEPKFIDQFLSRGATMADGTNKRTPVDAVQSFGMTLVHEVSPEYNFL